MEDLDVKPILSKESLLSTLWSDGVLLNTTVVAPSPSKDFCQLLISADETITIRKWIISCRKRDHCEKPKEQKITAHDFLKDAWTRGDVERVFGEETLKHAVNIARGHVDLLPRLPRQVLVKIIGYLPLQDIPKLSYVSKQFHELCSSNDLWQHLYHVHNDARLVTDDLRTHAERVGWRTVFFANKLQLQRHLRRGRDAKKVAILPPLTPAVPPEDAVVESRNPATSTGAATTVTGGRKTAAEDRKRRQGNVRVADVAAGKTTVATSGAASGRRVAPAAAAGGSRTRGSTQLARRN